MIETVQYVMEDGSIGYIPADQLDDYEKKKIVEANNKNLSKCEPLSTQRTLELLKAIYERINLLQDLFFDDTEVNKKLTTLWIIGTYMYKNFNTFPYLQFNAMKGSGKSRKLKFIKSLCWKGELLINLTESVLFRTASDSTLILDECEQIATKEKTSLREILNAGYKRGGVVKKSRRTSGKEGDKWVIDTFDIYAPKALANINGFDDVLADRAITITMDKSDDPAKVNLIENFEDNLTIKDIKRTLDLIQCSLCSLVNIKNNNILSHHWNVYTLTTYNTLTTLTTLTTLKPLTLTQEEYDLNNLCPLEEWEVRLFEKVNKAGINGRNFELYFPLFVIANLISPEVLDNLINIAKQKVNDKKKDDTIENKDVALIEFVSKKVVTLEYFPIKELTWQFKEFYSDDDDLTFINTRWLGRALKRLNLVMDKRRLNRGYEVMLNINKAKEKLKMFKDVDTEMIKQIGGVY